MNNIIIFSISLFISFFIVSYIAHNLFTRLAKKSGANGIWQWIKSFYVNTEKWNQETLLTWEYHPPVWYRFIAAVIGIVMTSILIYIELTPGKQEGLIGIFYFIMIFFVAALNSSKNVCYLLTNIGIYRIQFWRKKGKQAEKVILWHQTDRYHTHDKEIILTKKVDDPKDFYDIPKGLLKKFAQKSIIFPDEQIMKHAVVIIKQNIESGGHYA